MRVDLKFTRLARLGGCYEFKTVTEDVEGLTEDTEPNEARSILSRNQTVREMAVAGWRLEDAVLLEGADEGDDPEDTVDDHDDLMEAPFDPSHDWKRNENTKPHRDWYETRHNLQKAYKSARKKAEKREIENKIYNHGKEHPFKVGDRIQSSRSPWLQHVVTHVTKGSAEIKTSSINHGKPMRVLAHEFDHWNGYTKPRDLEGQGHPDARATDHGIKREKFKLADDLKEDGSVEDLDEKYNTRKAPNGKEVYYKGKYIGGYHEKPHGGFIATSSPEGRRDPDKNINHFSSELAAHSFIVGRHKALDHRRG